MNINLKYPVLFFVAAIFVLLNCSYGSHEKRGDGYFSKGRYQDALAEYLMAKRSTTISPEILFKIGMTSTRMGDMGTACAHYDTLLSIDSSREQWIINDLYQFGVKSLAEGDTTSMRESFQTILDIDPTYNLGDSFYHLARAYKGAGQYKRAVNAYLKALSYAPDSPVATSVLFELAQCYEQLRMFREAIAYYEDYLEQEEVKTDAEVMWHLGNTAYSLAADLFDEGNFDEALEYFQMVITSGQPQVLVIDAWFLSGEIYFLGEEFEKALEAYNEVINLNPSHTMKVASKSLERIREIRYGGKK